MATPIKAAGGVVYKPARQDESPSAPKVLMIYRRDVWDLPKGKKESEESRRDCAIREVSEEVGIDSPAIKGDLGTTYHEYNRDEDRYGKTTYWYAMQINGQNSFTPQEEEDIEEVRWMTVYDAKKEVEFDNLKKLLDRFEVWYWDQHQD